MIAREIFAKSILSKSKIQDYTVNPYVGCSHSCRYCYAAFMRRYTGHREKWGEFVDIKVNAPDLLAREIKKNQGAGSGSAASATRTRRPKSGTGSRPGASRSSWNTNGP